MQRACGSLGIIVLGVLGACHGGHGDASPPQTNPIPAVTTDAVYVVNGGDASITVIDAVASTVLGTIEFTEGEFPHHLALSEDEAELLVAFPGHDLSLGHAGAADEDDHDHASGAVARLDAQTGATLASVLVDVGNHNVMPGPDGNLWTALGTTPGLALVLDGTTLVELDRVPVGDGPSEITIDDERTAVWVTNSASDSVTAVDWRTHAVLATLLVGDVPVGAWPGPGAKLYVDNEADRSLTVIDARAYEVQRTIDLGFTPGMARIAPNGRLWVTDADAGRLVVLDADSGAQVDELALGAGAHAIAFSADGQRAWVTNQTAGTVSVIGISALVVEATIPVGAKPNGLVFRTAL